ncbi:MAG TPA: aldo/keto reductase [Bacillota bacterium]|jgi:aryl-alcohol dehydrogenase-like predicted oxidoreductase/ferredoxin|nr:aldo/keto reductase [Bacillota bacterium]HQJ37790.1 aldo/keto reductase [Bacillota bacterium]HQL36924.1 aldo/keto reductase [Bacillota bacterium]HRU40444.1 aldo/keto reductase [Candidatus Diapherotrites archaeon]
MKKNILGKTGIQVTELCFGALPMGPIQKNLSVEEATEVVACALENGITFVDTAQIYKTYSPIKAAIKKTGIRPVIASKSTAASYDEMEKAVKEALDGMGIDYIDIFHLHAPKANPDVFDIRKGALQCLLDYKSRGIIKAVGISTHNVKVVEAAAERQDLDIVFPLLNKAGRGIVGGTEKEMRAAISRCRQNGKGIYLMKVLGGGTLLDEYSECLEYARNLDCYDSIAVGMVSKEEVIYNVRYFNNEKNMEKIIITKNRKRVQVLQGACISCGKCIEVCHSSAPSFDHKGKSYIDQSKCIQCGYCIPECPAFAIRMA